MSLEAQAKQEPSSLHWRIRLEGDLRYSSSSGHVIPPNAGDATIWLKVPKGLSVGELAELLRLKLATLCKHWLDERHVEVELVETVSTDFRVPSSTTREEVGTIGRGQEATATYHKRPANKEAASPIEVDAKPPAFIINGLREDVSALPEHPSPHRRASHAVTTVMDSVTPLSELRVFIPEEEWRAIWEHCRSSVQVEVMGELVGCVRRDAEGPYLEIGGHLPARHVASTRTSAHETSENKIHSLQEKEKRFPAALYLGWYHTHPDLGVFLSDVDVQTKQLAFPLWYQIALVIDPVRHQVAFFRSREGTMTQLDKVYLFRKTQ